MTAILGELGVDQRIQGLGLATVQNGTKFVKITTKLPKNDLCGKRKKLSLSHFFHNHISNNCG
jgi:hypothetical protein